MNDSTVFSFLLISSLQLSVADDSQGPLSHFYQSLFCEYLGQLIFRIGAQEQSNFCCQ